MLKLGQQQLAKAHCMDPRIDAEMLYCHLKNIDKVKLFLEANDPVEEETCESFFSLIEKRAERVPLQYILGTQEFMGFTFQVGEEVLIPRQDTEILVEEAAKIIVSNGKRWAVLDLCCGSGAVGISLDKICANANVTGTDISPQAVAMAKKNGEALRSSVKFIEGDLYGAIKRKKYGMIISNPPYIPTHRIAILQDEVKNHEPMIALDGGSDGLDFYEKIIGGAAKHLKKQGVLILEIGHDQAEAVCKLIANERVFAKAEVIKDLPGKDRVVSTRLLK